MANGKMPGMDRRFFPRINVDPHIRISGDLEGELINISDRGLGFSTDDPIDLAKCTLKIDFPAKSVTVPVEIKWKTRSGLDNATIAGASLATKNEDVDFVMRKFMITRQFKDVVKDIKDRKTRHEILAFARDFRDYLFDLVALNNDIEHGASGLDKEKTFRKLTELNNAIVSKGEALKGKVASGDTMTDIKRVFRSLVSSWIFKSCGSYRCLDKPKGYPGDYETLEIIYDRRVFSPENELGYFFDLYFLNNPYAEAVRERKNKLKDILEHEIGKSSGGMDILNLACGACKEIRDIVAEKKKNVMNKEVRFYCLDWDEEALAFSKKQLEKAPSNFQMDFLRENVISFVRKTDFYEKNGKMDLIYSIGLADYFTDRILKAMVGNAHKGLKSGGKFIIAHKDREISFSHIPPEWFGDWTFFQRNEQELFNIIDDVGADWREIKVDRDKTGDIFFYTLVKR